MAEIKLNKPLYEEKAGSESCASGTCPTVGRQPRPPRPGILTRAGAAVIDLLLLHFIGLFVIRFAAQPIIVLGDAAPWLGLAVGWLYFAIGASSLTGGRTLGKVILQLRTVDVTGPELGFAKAAARSALVLWPLALFLLADRIGETYDRPDTLTLAPMWARVAGAGVFGWWLGNVLFASFDPYGRALWDCWIGSVVITSDCEAEALGEFMRAARMAQQQPMTPRSAVALVVTFLMCVGGFTAMVWWEAQRMAQLPTEDRERFIAQKKKLYVPGFGQPVPLGPSRGTEPGDEQTSTAHFQYRRRGTIDTNVLKNNPAVVSKARELAEVSLEEMRRLVRNEKADVPLDALPAKVRFDVGFASYCDLLFAWDAVEILTFSHTIALREELEAVRRGPAQDKQTTATGSSSGAR
jgi:hypothetical protein